MRIYKRLMIHQKRLDIYCDDCGDVIETGDFYYRETVKHKFAFIPDEKFNVCVGCHTIEKEVESIENSNR